MRRGGHYGRLNRTCDPPNHVADVRIIRIETVVFKFQPGQWRGTHEGHDSMIDR